MQHWAIKLQNLAYPVTYIKAAETFEKPLQNWVKTNNIKEMLVMQPNDKPFLEILNNLQIQCKITLVPNNQFLWTEEEFLNWAKPRKRLIMEDFYREGRQKFAILMQGKLPIGGQWNFDKENRKPPKGKLNTPAAKWFQPDDITQEVINYWKQQTDIQTYGKIEPFHWGVTRPQALQVLDYFITHRLPDFGPYQDAMVTGEETMWHSLISPYLNLGLLHPLEIIEKAEQAYYQNNLDLNSIEGFIRQILGWREYMRGMYIFVDKNYPQLNHFKHNQPLPAFFWDAKKTEMNCLKQTLSQIERTGYAHHIQRLMILSNFALISGLNPQEFENWFHSVFIDAYDWVMQTNVIGMGLFADGGILASKPYAASANYVNNMSDYCKNCSYNHKEKITENACPFNFFYWDFLDRHYDKLKSQGRMSFILKNLERMTNEEMQSIRKNAENWHQKW
jgi:deoxyribodipyrimidine photolyase-related protein